MSLDSNDAPSAATTVYSTTQEKASNEPSYDSTSTSAASSAAISLRVVAPTQYVECVAGYLTYYEDGFTADGFEQCGSAQHTGSADFDEIIREGFFLTKKTAVNFTSIYLFLQLA